jgi:hypothetical protein
MLNLIFANEMAYCLMIDVVSILRDAPFGNSGTHLRPRAVEEAGEGEGAGRAPIDFTSVKHVIAKIRMPRHVGPIARLDEQAGGRTGERSVKLHASAASGRSLHRT